MSYCRWVMDVFEYDRRGRLTGQTVLTSRGRARPNQRGFTSADVYLYDHGDGGWECCGCMFIGGPNAPGGGYVKLRSLADTIAHMMEHLAARHLFPARVLDLLWIEMLSKRRGRGKWPAT